MPRNKLTLPDLTPADLLDIRDPRDPLPALRHVVEAHATAYADDPAIVVSEHHYGLGIRTGLTHGQLRALLSELEMYRRQDEAEGDDR